MKKITIVAENRAETCKALDKVINHYALSEFITLSTDSLVKENSGAVFYLGENHINDEKTNQLVLPLRVGKLLDILRKQLRDNNQNIAYKIGPYTLNAAEMSLVHNKSQETVRLTDKEVEILIFLHENKGHGNDKDALLKHIWGYSEEAETHTIETHIYRLRQKIEPDPANPQIVITTEKGYVLGE